MSAERRPIPPRTIYLAAALLVFLVLCLSLTICLATSPRPAPPVLPAVQPNELAAETGVEKITAVADGPLGEYTVSLSEEEATSLMALRLPGSPFLNPQVRFRDGRFYVNGTVSMGVPLGVQSMWAIAGNGAQPRVVLERASIGPFALPGFLLSSVSSTINEMIVESGTGVLPTAIGVEDGTISIKLIKSTPAIP